MEAHARAPLSPIGRRRVVDRVVCEGWSVAAAAAAAGVCAGARRPGRAEAAARGAYGRSCGGGGGGGCSPRSCGGGGGRSAAGGSPGQTSRTRHGAWSTTKRAWRPRLLGPSRSSSPSRASTSRSAPTHAATTSRSTRPWRTSVARLAAEAVARVGQERAGGVVGDLVPARAARCRRTAPEQPGPPARGHLLELARRDREQRDVGVGGRERGGGLDARLPPRLGYPHDDSHQTTRRANHSASVEASRIGGTVSAPRRTNSPMSVSWSCAWSTRRQSSVASEPT